MFVESEIWQGEEEWTDLKKENALILADRLLPSSLILNPFQDIYLQTF
jgi:hypothetical protein